jgi:hypothetical protein
MELDLIGCFQEWARVSRLTENIGRMYQHQETTRRSGRGTYMNVFPFSTLFAALRGALIRRFPRSFPHAPGTDAQSDGCRTGPQSLLSCILPLQRWGDLRQAGRSYLERPPCIGCLLWITPTWPDERGKRKEAWRRGDGFCPCSRRLMASCWELGR